jgi:antitoxin MazE
MRVTVRKWGNSASVRIPASIMAAADLRIDQAVDITEEDGRIVILPIGDPASALDALLDKMTPDTFHDEVDFGPAVGSEIW